MSTKGAQRTQREAGCSALGTVYSGEGREEESPVNCIAEAGGILGAAGQGRV